MRPLPILLATGLAFTATAPAQGRVSLEEIPGIARARSERQRPGQLARLEPFLADLRTDYGRNSAVLDETIRDVAALGDAVAPLLIEFLAPEDAGSSRSRWLAENARRVLMRLEPEVHIDTWIELAEGPHPLARRQAIELLGACDRDPRAAVVLARIAPSIDETWDEVVLLRAATGLTSNALTPFAAQRLRARDAEVRAAALEYLLAHPSPDIVPAAVQALPRETEGALLGRYVELFAKTARQDATVADALVPLVTSLRLDPEDLLALVRAFATIAPEDHDGSITALTAVLERGETGALGVQAALTLQALGDKRGPRMLFDRLDERQRERRASAAPYADRASAYFAFGRHKDAIRDYEQAISRSQPGSRQASYWLQIARCEAHRNSLRGTLRAIEESGVSAQTVRNEADKDPVFREMIEREQARKFLDALSR